MQVGIIITLSGHFYHTESMYSQQIRNPVFTPKEGLD